MTDADGKQHFVGNTSYKLTFVERDPDCIPVMTPSRGPSKNRPPPEMFNTISNYQDQYAGALKMKSGDNLLHKTLE